MSPRLPFSRLCLSVDALLHFLQRPDLLGLANERRDQVGLSTQVRDLRPDPDGMQDLRRRAQPRHHGAEPAGLLQRLRSLRRLGSPFALKEAVWLRAILTRPNFREQLQPETGKHIVLNI